MFSSFRIPAPTQRQRGANSLLWASKTPRSPFRGLQGSFRVLWGAVTPSQGPHNAKSVSNHPPPETSIMSISRAPGPDKAESVSNQPTRNEHHEHQPGSGGTFSGPGTAGPEASGASEGGPRGLKSGWKPGARGPSLVPGLGLIFLLSPRYFAFFLHFLCALHFFLPFFSFCLHLPCALHFSCVFVGHLPGTFRFCSQCFCVSPWFLLHLPRSRA